MQMGLRVWLGLLYLAGLCLAQEQTPARTSAPAPKAAPSPPTPQPDASEQRLQLNLLGQTDTASGESRRNENVQFNLIDRNAMRELNTRVGVTATPIDVFHADRGYYGGEYGRPATAPLHLPPQQVKALHGAFWNTHSNNLFRARSFFQADDVLPTTENDYGFRFGGKLAERLRLSLDGNQQKLRGFVNGNVLVPLPSERTPLTTDPFVRQVISRYAAAFPNEAPNRPDIDPRALNTNSPQKINTNALSTRLDAPLDEKNAVALRYQFTLQQVDAFQLVAGQNPDTDTHSQTAAATWTRTFSPTLLGYFSVGFERVTTVIRPEPGAVGPYVDFSNVFTTLGPAPGVPLTRAQNRFRYGAALDHVRGNHHWSVGGELLRTEINGREQDAQRGIVRFASDFGRDAITNFRLGTPVTYTQLLGNVHRGFRTWNVLLGLEDSWRPTPHVTLQLGLRYEPMSRPVEVNHIDTVPFPCDCNNFAPRAGVAYRLPQDWGVLRTAYGVQFGEIFETTYGQVRLAPPSSYRVIVPAPDLRDPLGGLTLATIPPGFRSSTFVVDSNLRTPYSHQYNFTWERGLGANVKVQLAYVGSRTQKLFQMRFDNRARVVPGIPQTTATVNDRRPDPRVLEVLRLLNGSRSYFDAARVTLVVPRWHGLNLDLSYWFSKSLDQGNDYTSTLGGTDARQGRSQAEQGVHPDLKGLSLFDQPHALLMRGSYDTPGLPGPVWMRRVVGKWVLSGILLVKNGTPFQIESGSDAPGFGNVDGQGSDRVNVVDPIVLGRIIGNPDTSQRQLPRGAFAFIRPTDDRGNIGRNTFRRGKIANVNGALERTFRLAQEWSLRFRAESINFFNTPQFAEPNFTLASPSFGAITNTLNDGRTFRLLLRLQF